jgi:hypothetical protein
MDIKDVMYGDAEVNDVRCEYTALRILQDRVSLFGSYFHLRVDRKEHEPMANEWLKRSSFVLVGNVDQLAHKLEVCDGLRCRLDVLRADHGFDHRHHRDSIDYHLRRTVTLEVCMSLAVPAESRKQPRFGREYA